MTAMAGDPGPAPGVPARPVYSLPLDDTAAAAGATGSGEAGDWSEPLLRQNAIWFCQLRWMVVGVLAAGGGVVGLFPAALARLGFPIAPVWPLGTAALLALLNLGYRRLATSSERGGFPPVRLLLWTQIVSDLLILTVVIHWVDRGIPAAPFMYLFHLILACIVFPPGESLLVAGVAAAFYLAGLALEATGGPGWAAWVTPTGETAAPAEPSVVTLVVPTLLTWGVIWYLASRLAGAVRRRDRELAVTNRRLVASSEDRARHMLQTTHQLKAPFAAIHAQTQLLEGGFCGELPPAARSVIGKIAARCLALSRQIQEMLQLANLRSQGQVAPPLREIELTVALEDVIARIEPAARLRGIRIEKQFEPVRVTAVADHITMLLENLVVNAVNYSRDLGLVRVECRAGGAAEAEVVVSDRGIGIPADKLPRIFEDYYRTEEAVQHNRASTGLGLAIVRQVAQALRAAIRVESAPGWGTRFTVNIPCQPALSLSPQPH